MSLSSTFLREDELIVAAMALLTDKPFSEIHGSVRAELIAFVSHNHLVFGDDSAKVLLVFQFLEEARHQRYCGCFNDCSLQT